MKAKLTKLTAALLLAGLAGGAQAAIDQTGTNNGELFFSVWDPTRGTSYTRDLALNLTDVTPAGVATQQGTIYSFSADALLTTFLGDTTIASGNFDDLIWNIGAGDNQGIGAGALRGLYTGNAATTEASIETMSSTQFTNALTNMNSQIGQLNNQPTHNSLTDGSNVATQGGDPNDDNAYAGLATWGRTAGYLVGTQTAGQVGEALNFWFITSGPTNFSKVAATQFFGELGAAVWNFASDGTLTFAAPVPEAETWALLGLGLVGLGFYARRRTGTQAQPLALA